MSLAVVVTSSLLAAVLAFAALRKLSHREEVVQSYMRVGVPRDKLDYLAAILLVGAGGLAIGLFWAPIGVAATIGVIVYFLLAVAAHLRADDARNLPTPGAIELVAIATLALRLASH